MPIIKASISDKDDVAPLIALFRVELKAYKNEQSFEDLVSAKEEFKEYIQKRHPIYLYKEDDIVMGYIVCRVEDSVVWVEALYVKPDYRRKGIASKLYDTAEQLAKSFGEASLFNYVHPNNDNMIMFLKSKG